MRGAGQVISFQGSVFSGQFTPPTVIDRRYSI